MNSAEYIDGIVHAGFDNGEITGEAAVAILSALVMVLNGSGNEDHHLPGMAELHRKVMQRYDWVRYQEEPRW